jgi:hypothetical protein
MDGMDLAALPPADRSMAIMDVCDRAILQLGEARTIEEVKRVGDLASAFAAYTRKIKAALEAQNATNLVVALAEARIGAELKAAQERGEVARHGGDRSKVQGPDLGPPTLSDLGVPKQRASEYRKLADLGAANIREVVAEATAAEVPVSRSLMIAASDAVSTHVTEAKATGEPVTERTIRAAIRSVLPAREPRVHAPSPIPEDMRLPDAWTDLLGAVETMATLRADLPDLWRRTPHGLRRKLREEARRALPRMTEWAALTENADDTE